MDTTRFDNLTRSVSLSGSRRGLLSVFAAVALGLAAAPVPTASAARKRAKRRNKRLVTNAFGCVDVGAACRGNSDNCCSGICEGSKPKKGQRDKSRCVAHNVLTCLATQDNCLTVPNPCGAGGSCFRTTGEASFCGNQVVCMPCARDTDCEAIKGPGAACIVCPSVCPDGQQSGCVKAYPA